MILKKGDRILVAHRRLFEQDEVRFFVGAVEEYDIGVVKATGRSCVRDKMSGRMIEKPDERVKILSLASGALLVYQLPDGVDIDALRFEVVEFQLLLTDGKAFKMNLTEHAHDGLL